MKTVYKIICPIFCALLFPVFYFLPVIRIFISSSLSENLMKSIGLKEHLSIKYILSSVNGSNEATNSLLKNLISSLRDKDSAIGQMFTNAGWLYAAAICLLVTLLLALVIIAVAVFTKKYVLSSSLTLGAMVTLFAADKCFDGFASPLLSGKIGISNLISSAASSESGDLLGGLFGSIVKLKVLQLDTAYSAAMFIFGIVLILGICAIVETKYSKN